MALGETVSTRRGFLRAAGQALGALGAASLPFSQALAGDAKTASWNNPELEEFHKASTAARDYAENNIGVGILIHVGKDIPNAKIKSGDELGQLFVNRFSKLGVEAQYFLSQNDARFSGITYHIGHQIHGAENRTEVKSLKAAWSSAPDVIEQLKIVKELASLEAPEPSGS